MSSEDRAWERPAADCPHAPRTAPRAGGPATGRRDGTLAGASLCLPRLLVVDERGRGEGRADGSLARRLGGDGHATHVDDPRVLADPIEEDAEVVVIPFDVHDDRELLIELHQAQRPGVELPQLEVRLVGEVLDPL